jgi:arylformamidase
VDQLSLDVLVGPAVVGSFAPARELQEISVPDMERVLGKTLSAPRVLLRYDWSARWGDRSFYSKSPFLSHEACKWLLEHGVRLIGMDTPSPDNPAHSWGSGHDSPNHHLFLANDVILLEYLCNLDQIRSERVSLVALPLKVCGGDGAPTRAIAIEDA